MDLRQGIHYESRLRFLRSAMQRAMQRMPEKFPKPHVTCEHPYCILRRALTEEAIVQSGEEHANESGIDHPKQ